MTEDQKIGIVVDEDFAIKNNPPYPHPIFLSYENPLRIRMILNYLNSIKIWNDKRIIKIPPKIIEEEHLNLAHTKYYIDAIKRFSGFGSGVLDDEIYITPDTFYLAKKAVGGAISAIEKVVKKELNQSFALIRPPGHHALREKGSGLCIFNNIANAILYLRKELNYNKKIAIIDIDDHFGDGLVQYFYQDPSVLYFSIHEFDFIEGDMGFINELGAGEGIGTTINFPVPPGITDHEFLDFLEVLEPILREYEPDIIIVAIGFDMYFDDAIGNCFLTSNSYYEFTKEIYKIAKTVCEGKVAFILEGGYSLVGLPICVHAVIKALLNESHEREFFENQIGVNESKKEDVAKIKSSLLKLLKDYWKL
ncbi:MAG: histone deacetylase [Promethearchaeota archaeon]|nr:MAG: histone deacetylase [Candidatus Lokiarchaeota archaeon]